MDFACLKVKKKAMGTSRDDHHKTEPHHKAAELTGKPTEYLFQIFH